jgi:hypothetical protein
MTERYVVYVTAPDWEPTAEERARLANLLSLDIPKLDALLRRLPAEVTKPVPESTAVTVARRFREAGLDASIRSAESSEQVAQPAQPARREAQPAVGREQADQDDAWRTQFGGGRKREDAEQGDEDDLFPPSAFSAPKGPNSPSKPLVIALVVVLAVFAVLWLLF